MGDVVLLSSSVRFMFISLSISFSPISRASIWHCGQKWSSVALFMRNIPGNVRLRSTGSTGTLGVMAAVIGLYNGIRGVL